LDSNLSKEKKSNYKNILEKGLNEFEPDTDSFLQKLVFIPNTLCYKYYYTFSNFFIVLTAFLYPYFVAFDFSIE